MTAKELIEAGHRLMLEKARVVELSGDEYRELARKAAAYDAGVPMWMARIEESGGVILQRTIFFPADVVPSEKAAEAIHSLIQEWNHRIVYEDDLDEFEDAS